MTLFSLISKVVSKCALTWDRSKSKNSQSSCWIRVSQALAGDGWGMKFTPQINTEVWIDFINGDPDRPVITRQAYNGLNCPPFSSESGNCNGIQSPNEEPHIPPNILKFDDSCNSNHVRLNAQKKLLYKAKNNIRIAVKGRKTHYQNRQSQLPLTARRISSVSTTYSFTIWQ